MEFTVTTQTLIDLAPVVMAVVTIMVASWRTAEKTRDVLRTESTHLKEELTKKIEDGDAALKADNIRIETSLTKKIDDSHAALLKKIDDGHAALLKKFEDGDAALKADNTRIETGLSQDIARLDDRVYALGVGLRPLIEAAQRGAGEDAVAAISRRPDSPSR